MVIVAWMWKLHQELAAEYVKISGYADAACAAIAPIVRQIAYAFCRTLAENGQLDEETLVEAFSKAGRGASYEYLEKNWTPPTKTQQTNKQED